MKIISIITILCALSTQAQITWQNGAGPNKFASGAGPDKFAIAGSSGGGGGGGGSFSDNFNRADGALGANWTCPSGATAFTIVSQQVQPGAEGFANNLDLWTGSSLTGNISNSVVITGSIITSETYYGVVQCDINGNGGYIWANNATAGLILETFTGNAAGSLLQSDSTPVVSGTVLGMVVRSTGISCYTNGVLDFTYSTSATTGLLPGIYFTGNHSAPSDTMDNAAGAGGF